MIAGSDAIARQSRVLVGCKVEIVSCVVQRSRVVAAKVFYVRRSGEFWRREREGLINIQ